MTKKKQEQIKCLNCPYYKDDECTHTSNIGILIKYRKEKPFYKKSAKDLEKTCKIFKEDDI